MNSAAGKKVSRHLFEKNIINHPIKFVSEDGAADESSPAINQRWLIMYWQNWDRTLTQITLHFNLILKPSKNSAKNHLPRFNVLNYSRTLKYSNTVTSI